MAELNQLIQQNLAIIIFGIIVLFILLPKKGSGSRLQKTTTPKQGSYTLNEDVQPQPETRSKLKDFIDHWPEVWMIPLLLLTAAAINYGLMQIWPDAIFLGPEQIQTILYKTVASFLAYFLFFVRDRLDFKEAWTWYISPTRAKEHEQLTPWQKRVTYFWRLSVFVLVFALV